MRHVAAMHQKVRHLRSVFGGGFPLLHHIGAGVKLRRLRFGQRERSIARIAQPLRRWRQETFQAQKKVIVGAAGGHRIDGQPVRDRQALARPIAVAAARVGIGALLHIFQRGQEHVVLGHRHPLFEFLRGRHKHHGRLQLHWVLLDGCQIKRNQRPLSDIFGLSRWRPILIQRDQQLAVQQPHYAGFQRQRQLLCSVGQQQIILMRKGTQVAHHNRRVMALSVR